MANSYSIPVNTSTAANANGAVNLSYSLIGQYDLGAAPPHEVLFDVKFTPSAAPSSPNKSSILLVASSLDGTNWSDAPTSATEMNARLLGSVAHPDTSARQTASLPLSPLFGGALPRYVRVYVKNDTGVAYASSGNSIVATSEIFG